MPEDEVSEGKKLLCPLMSKFFIVHKRATLPSVQAGAMIQEPKQVWVVCQGRKCMWWGFTQDREGCAIRLLAEK